jgi:hypothetical protein
VENSYSDKNDEDFTLPTTAMWINLSISLIVANC